MNRYLNRRVLAAALAAAPLALGIGAGTAVAQPPPVAPPLGSITAPLSSAPALPGKMTGWGFDNGTTLVAFSCAQTTARPAWSMPLAQKTLTGGGVAGFSTTVPIIDTTKVGPVEWAAYGPDPTAGPLLRSGCVDSTGQTYLNWGTPEIGSRAFMTPPPVTAKLAILPGEPAPVVAAPATTAPATTTAPFTTSATVPTAQVPAYTGTPDTAQSGRHTTDSGGNSGTPWVAIIFGLLTVLFGALSRATSWRVRRDDDKDTIPMRGHLYGGAAALAGLIAASSAPTSIGGFFGAAVLAVLVALVLSAQRAASSGYRVSLVALIQTARTDWRGAGLGAGIGYVIGYITGSGLLTPGALYGLLAGAGIGIGAVHLRQTHARVAAWKIDAATVADILGVKERDILETGEVAFATTAEGGVVVTTLNQTARSHLPGIEDRCADIAPHLMVTHADRLRVEIGPVDAATAAHRESMTGSGGLVGGAHSGADPWTGEAPAPGAAGSVDMHKPSTGTGDAVVDLSAGWD